MPSFRGKIVNHQILLTVHVSKPGEIDENGTDGVSSVTALLDTGATMSGVSKGLIEHLELIGTGEWESIAGVHGLENVPLYEVDLVLPISEILPDNEQTTFARGVGKLKVMPLSIGASNFEVLLGMDFLESFHLTIYRDMFILSN